ncbi:olfactory receptor 2A12-like [Spea bombifrons]|uniref:olfactory receptor 2A12-like n=1 Tax=Spea bombifrons TaxID=233779 RepID=UPI0023490657|nr:olfactory receptor 2A12-like [Spea bombifrons]
MQRNLTSNHEFHILAFSNYTGLQFPLAFWVLLMYLFSMFGNLIITGLVCLVSILHTPMYFFLCNLSVQDIVYVSAILPKLLAITITGDSRILFSGCITQMFLFVSCVITEFLLLTAMAYDRYVAICIPLQYVIIMNKNTCALLATACWLVSSFTSLKYAILVSNLSFCCSQEINHFFCDMKTMMRLSCSDTTIIHKVMFTEAVLLGILPFLLILTSYVYISSAILKIHSLAGRAKAFSSCSSHMTVVIVFFGTTIIVYLKPDTGQMEEQEKLFSMLYIAVVPALNPLVYSMRNKDVIGSIRKLFGKTMYKL